MFGPERSPWRERSYFRVQRPFDQGFDAPQIALQDLEEFAGIRAGVLVHALFQFIDQKRDGVKRGAQIVGDERQVLILLCFTQERLLFGKVHDGLPDSRSTTRRVSRSTRIVP